MHCMGPELTDMVQLNMALGTVKIQYTCIAVRYFTKSSLSQIGHGSQIFHKQKNLKT